MRTIIFVNRVIYYKYYHFQNSSNRDAMIDEMGNEKVNSGCSRRERDSPIWRVSYRSMHLSTPSLPDEAAPSRDGEKEKEGERERKRDRKDAVQRTTGAFLEIGFPRRRGGRK